MKARRIALSAEVMQYEIGKHMEDGFETLSDVVTKDWIFADRLIKIEGDNGVIKCPYVMSRRGKIFLNEGDYVIIDEDGTKQVCGADKIWKRYEPIE